MTVEPAPWPSGESSASASGASSLSARPLCQAVAAMCSALLPHMSEHTARGLRAVLARLSSPLQVAVAGRIKSGKSTLVNALIGRRVAPTDVGECTHIVTRFQYGTVDRVEIVFHDGTTEVVPFDADGVIPSNLGVDLDTVSHLEAYLTNAVLRDLTVIDTPGLGSLDDRSVARTEQVLGAVGPESAAPSETAGRSEDSGSEGNNADEERLDPVSSSALAGAEAVLYVVTQTVRADDRDVLSAFTAATGRREAGPLNAIAVLNKADTVVPDSVDGAGDDVWAAASMLANKQAEVLKPRVADVLPLNGLLAETCETGSFTAQDADALHVLAGIDSATLDTALSSADLFSTVDCEVSEETRSGLAQRLDLYGVRRAVDVIRQNSDVSAGELRRILLESSGLAEVTTRLDALFRTRADGIKAAAALASITAIARASDNAEERQKINAEIEALLANPEAHQLRMLEALTLVSSGMVSLPDDLVDETLRIGRVGDPAQRLGMPHATNEERAAQALQRAGWWRSFASFGATPAQSRVAHVVHRAYFLLWRELDQQEQALNGGEREWTLTGGEHE